MGHNWPVSLAGNHRVRCVARSWFRFLAILLWPLCSSGIAFAQQGVAPALLDLPVTNGLIRWWPNLFDVREEITGEEGVVMGVLPPVETGADDETDFTDGTGWVQLRPAITNEVFTLAFWVKYSEGSTSLIGQQAAESEWLFHTTGKLPGEFYVGRDHPNETELSESVKIALEVWQHVAVSRKEDSTSTIWLDGTRALEGRAGPVRPRDSRWLMAGSRPGGSVFFRLKMRDLCAFNRVLADDEVQALHKNGVPRRGAQNTAARLAATERKEPVPVKGRITTGIDDMWMHRRFTIEHGLPGNAAIAALQARDGHLWVGTETGLARFDGRSFRAFTAENTPALRQIGATVLSLAEDGDGTIWAGLFGGLLRIRNLEFTAFTNGLPQRFVLQAQPAGDGSVWVAAFNAFVPRGPLWLRRYHPHAGACSAEVLLPGHLRQMAVVTNGLWLATEQPAQLQFWDGRSAITTVAVGVDFDPLRLRFARRPVLPFGAFCSGADMAEIPCDSVWGKFLRENLNLARLPKCPSPQNDLASERSNLLQSETQNSFGGVAETQTSSCRSV